MMGNREVISGIERHKRNQRYHSIIMIVVMLVIAGVLVLRIWGVI